MDETVVIEFIVPVEVAVSCYAAWEAGDEVAHLRFMSIGQLDDVINRLVEARREIMTRYQGVFG